ncbi:hypothetical protein AQUCO_03700126v1 [Aquilegia coerulea]|uniref:ATP-dependent RNA helicase n=1 Tax=Aquilegia coerulea TaxID=218851 RepID=A0A2G5CTT4_AQUCA|nr:hypothetical protein AQUCO_03700126v1 [Aquilegia coerulea]
MKFSSSIPSSSRGISVFSKVFPFKCKYFGLGRNGLVNGGSGARKFSSGSSPASFRSRIGGSRSSELSRSRGGGGGERGGFQGGSFSGRIGQAKSLIEEEDEVDDWISELKPDSFRLEGTSGSDDENSGRDRFRGSGRGRDSGSMRSQRVGRGGLSASRRSRETEDSDLGYGQRQVGGSLLGGRKQALQIFDADDEKKEKAIPSFGDFLSEEDSEEDDEEDLKPISGSALKDKTHPVPDISSGKDESYLSETRFDQCAISSLSMKGIKDAGYEKMTVVQEATLPIILKGKDVLAKARTGTGKTVAFLLPAIEAIVKLPPVDRDQKRPPINVLVVCPTRELASQAAAEAAKLLKYHSSIGVQIVIGGVRLSLEQKRLQANPCQILVATPGRLKDHIENTAGFATRLMGVKVLVLDEADHLLDMGFRKDIEKIIAAVPKQRQTLLFSATVPEDVRQICHIALKRDHEFINTVEEGSEETHALVRQMHLVAPLDKQFSLLYALLKDHIADDIDYKVLVFCTTAMVTKLVADLLSELKMNVREIHSRKPQSYRTRVSDEFRKSKGRLAIW